MLERLLVSKVSPKMQILLSDASSLTSRQVATILSRQGHTVHVLSTSAIPLTRFTRHVYKVHRVPPFGPDPYLWLGGALQVLRNYTFDFLLCTQEQVAIISAEAESIRDLGVRFAVPDFNGLKKVMDKISAYDTLSAAGLQQPESIVVKSVADLYACSYLLPAYIKTPIGTASSGVQFIATDIDLRSVAKRYGDVGSFDGNGQLLVQKAVQGPLLMISGVFSHGHLVAWHACLRVKEGMGGGASKKSSLPLPEIGEHLAKLGGFLKWHGAISMDGILKDNEVIYIDVNPRIVEPVNALNSGVDLVDTLLRVSATGTDSAPEALPAGKVGIKTHQLVLAILKAGIDGRMAVAKEVYLAILGQDSYQGSVEELTPCQGDILSFILICSLVLIVTVGGSIIAGKLSQNAVSSYALSQNGWHQILKKTEQNSKEKGI